MSPRGIIGELQAKKPIPLNIFSLNATVVWFPDRCKDARILELELSNDLCSNPPAFHDKNSAASDKSAQQERKK